MRFGQAFLTFRPDEPSGFSFTSDAIIASLDFCVRYEKGVTAEVT
jgi:hypothetical protein